jgi:DNA repair protein RadC
MSQFNSQAGFLELLVREAKGEYRLASGDEVLKEAKQVIGRRVRRGTSMTSPELVRDFLRTKLAELPHEVFVAILLDAQNP